MDPKIVFKTRRKELGTFRIHEYPDSVVSPDWIGYVDVIYDVDGEIHYSVVYKEYEGYFQLSASEGEYTPFDPQGKNPLQRKVSLLVEEDSYYAELDKKNDDPVT